MKTKLTLITLIACAAAGTAFAADPVRAFRASSGTTTNSIDAVYVGNPVWASDAQQIGEKYVADLFLAYESPTFTWDSELNAFCQDETGYSDDDPTHHGGSYRQYNAVFALTGTAQFTNAADATLTFRCESETAGHYSGYDPERKEYFNVEADNLILFADSSKFTNEGTISYESYFTGTAGGTYEDWNNGKPIGFSVLLRDDAVFENAGTISAEPDNYVEWVEFDIFGNAKFVNTASGKIRGIDLWLSGDSVFENAGMIVNRGVSSTDDIYISLRENAKLVNTGAIDSDKYNFSFEAGFSGTSKIENRGKMTGADVDFRIGNDPILGISASFENYGTIKPEENSSSAVAFGVKLRDLDKSGNDVDFRDLADAYTETMHAGDLNVKNFGTIDLAGTGTMSVLSGVKLTLAQGSTIAGNLEVGKNLEFYLDNTFCTLHIDEDVLNIELTGKGGSEALISGDLELCNSIELDVSFAEDAVKKTKYELTLWGGELTYGTDYTGDGNLGFIESSLSGTLEGFGTTYTWNLDTATGVLTASADPVRAFRASSGTTTNSVDAVYVGNTDWGSDSKEIGEKYFKDLNLSHGSTSFTWDEDKKAFYNGFENWSFDTIFALTGTASFVNESNSLAVFQYAGDKKEHDGDMTYENTILFADSSKFENRGEFLMEYEVSDAWSAPRFVTWLRDNAVFENSGLISSDYRYSDQSLRPALDYFLLAGNSKLINTESGEIRIRDENNPSNDELDFFRVHIYENSTFENAGTVRLNLARLAENGCFLNTGTVVSNSGAIEFLPKTARPEHNLVVSNSGAIEFLSREGWSAGTPRVENRGEMTVPNIKFIYVSEEMTERSALVENYGTWSSSSGGPINIEIDYDGDASTFSTTFKGIVAASDLQVKNFGTISAPNSLITLDSGVKLTLGEGSNIDSDVAIGTQIRNYYDSREFRLNKDVLNIVLTGKGGSDALISDGLEVCNLVELNVSLAEDAVKKTKYELTIWGGELTFDETDSIYDPETGEYVPVHHDSGFIKTTGTLEGFGTTYTWNLDTATGVLTAKDVDIGEEIDLTSPTQNVELGEKDVATLDPSLTEYSGTVSGAGQVSSSGDVEFSGDASALTGRGGREARREGDAGRRWNARA